MGNNHSTDTRASLALTRGQVYAALTRHLEKNFEAYETALVKSTFDQLATLVGETLIWTEDTFVKFLELPDEIGSVLFLSAAYAAAFPFTNESPKLLTYDALLRALALMTERTDSIFTPSLSFRLVFNSFATIKEPPDPQHTEPPGLFVEEEVYESAGIAEQESISRISRKDFKRLLQFLLTIQEKRKTEVVAHYIERFHGKTASQFLDATNAIVNTMSSSETVSYLEVERFSRDSPNLLSALSNLYAHFLFPAANGKSQTMPRQVKRSFDHSNLLNDATAAQLSLFLPPELIFGSVDDLYIASRDGFSMGSVETKVCRYPGPSITLVSGFLDSAEIELGFFSNTPWKQSSKLTFGDSETVMFELSPYHEVYKSSKLKHGAFFSKATGIGVGLMPLDVTENKVIEENNNSMYLDTSLEIAQYRSADGMTKRIRVQNVEIWGLGGDKEAQRKAWAWEEAEADRRRTVNIHDIQADYGMEQQMNCLRSQLTLQ